MKLNGKKIYLFSAIILLLTFFLTVNFCSAAFLKNSDSIKTQTDASASGGYETGDLNNLYALAQTVISAFLAIIGVLLLAYLLYGGYYWMTARGEEEKVTKAKDTITRAIIGIIIIVGAYAISIFVMSNLEAGTLRGGSGTNTNQLPPVVPNNNAGDNPQTAG